MVKRFVSFTLLIVMISVCFLSGCRKTENGSQLSSDPTAAPTEEPTPEPTRAPKQNVAKVIFILGQSNAVGATLYAPLENTVGKDKFRQLSKGYENIKHLFFCEAGGADGVNNLTNISKKKEFNFEALSKMRCKLGQSWMSQMFGPEVGMAEYLSVNYPDETFYIVKVAKGGVSINSSWLDDGYCYKIFLDYRDKIMNVLKDAGYTPEVVAICWMQGENEATAESDANRYLEYQSDLAERVRRDLAEYAPYGGIPFVDAGISSNWSYYKTVNGFKREYADSSDLNYYFDTMELGYTYNKEPKGGVDYAHFDSESVWLLGQKFAEVAMQAYEKVK